jgi:hypothetical protein
MQTQAQPADPRAQITTNLYASNPTRVRHANPPENRKFLYNEDQTEDSTISPGDALFSLSGARVFGNNSQIARTAYVTPLLNNVELTNYALEKTQQKINILLSRLRKEDAFKNVTRGSSILDLANADTVKKLDANFSSEKLKPLRDLITHCAVFDHCLQFQGTSMVDVIATEDTKRMHGELQVSASQHGMSTLWNSGDDYIAVGDEVYLWLPPVGSTKGTGFKKPRFANRAWSETRKAAVYISNENLAKKIMEAFKALDSANRVVWTDEAANDKLRCHILEHMRFFFRSSFVGVSLSSLSEPQYYFDILRLV